MESKEIRVVRAERNVDDSIIDIVRTRETKQRTTPAKLKEQKAYLEASIANFQAELAEVNKLLTDTYAEIEK